MLYTVEPLLYFSVLVFGLPGEPWSLEELFMVFHKPCLDFSLLTDDCLLMSVALRDDYLLIKVPFRPRLFYC